VTFDGLALTASGLNENVAAGAYWIGLTPQADFGTSGQRFLEAGVNVVGDVAAYRNPGGSFGLPAGTGWGPASDISPAFRDVAMQITGKAVPTPGALALLGLAGVAARRRRRA
jgi:MYXO-CTERM domain-containing protein